MYRVPAIAILLACACGGSSSDAPDAAGGGGDPDGAIDPTSDGGTSGPRMVKLTLTNRPMNAATYSFFVAYQDGSAAWQLAPAPTGDTYTFPVSAPSFGVAYGCIGNVTGQTTTQLRTVTTAHFAVGERTDLTLDVPARCTDRQAMTVQLSGTVTNRPFSGALVVQHGTRSTFVSNQSGAFSMQVPPGTRDLIVAHVVPQGNGEFYIDDAVVIRDVMLNAATMRTIDFSAARPTDFYYVDVDVTNPNARVIAATTLYTANGTTLGLVRESAGWGTEALATVQRRASDVYDQSISVTTLGQGVTVTNATSTPGPQTFVAPSPLGPVTSTFPTKSPYPTLLTTWPAYAGTVGYTWNATQQLGPQPCGGNVACTIAWTAYVSPGVSGAMPGYRMPELASLAGWKPAFALVGGAQVVGSVTAQTSSAGAGDFPPGTPANGTKRQFVRSDYAVTP